MFSARFDRAFHTRDSTSRNRKPRVRQHMHMQNRKKGSDKRTCGPLDLECKAGKEPTVHCTVRSRVRTARACACLLLCM
eukprot:3043262-Prymnesium_polylepis.1